MHSLAGEATKNINYKEGLNENSLSQSEVHFHSNLHSILQHNPVVNLASLIRKI